MMQFFIFLHVLKCQFKIRPSQCFTKYHVYQHLTVYPCWKIPGIFHAAKQRWQILATKSSIGWICYWSGSKNIEKVFKKHRNTKIKKLSKMSGSTKLWLQFMEYVAVMFMSVFPERIGDWTLHLVSVREMINLFMVTRHNTYAKSNICNWCYPNHSVVAWNVCK